MMKTLSYFMLPNERRMSRMTTTETLDLGFQKGLFVQGFVHVSLLSFTEWNNAKTMYVSIILKYLIVGNRF